MTFKKEAWRISVIAIESYRVLSGTLLVVFVPGVCGNHACLPNENFEKGSTVYRINVIMNLIALLFFLALYGIEIRREYRLHTYLMIRPTLPTDSESVANALQLLKEDKKIKLHNLTHTYKQIGLATLAVFAANTVLSAYVIITEYGNDKGPMMLATNTLFIGGKLFDIYSIVTSDANIFFSAYEKQHLQFNAPRPNKCITIV